MEAKAGRGSQRQRWKQRSTGAQQEKTRAKCGVLRFPQKERNFDLRGVAGEAVAEVGGKASLDEGAYNLRERGGDGYEDPEKGGEDESGNGYGLERDGDDVGLVEAEAQGPDVGDEFHAMDDDGGEEEGGDRKGADGDEEKVDGPGEALAAAAVAALGEVLIVVGAHGGGDAGEVVAPAGENISHNLIGAWGT